MNNVNNFLRRRAAVRLSSKYGKSYAKWMQALRACDDNEKCAIEYMKKYGRLGEDEYV